MVLVLSFFAPQKLKIDWIGSAPILRIFIVTGPRTTYIAYNYSRIYEHIKNECYTGPLDDNWIELN